MAWPAAIGSGLAFSAHKSGRSGPWQPVLTATQGATTTITPIASTSSNLRLASLYTPAAAVTMQSIDVMLTRQGTVSGDIVVEVFATSGGVPTGSALATSSVVASTLSTSATYVQFPLSAPVSMASGSTYAIVIRNSTGTADATNHIRTYRSSSGNYLSYNGSTWTTNTGAGTLQLKVNYSEDAGPLYGVFVDGNSDIEVWKSTDGGQTWAEQDSANSPNLSGTTQSFDSVLVGSTLHIAYVYALTPSANYKSFDCATDTWSTAASSLATLTSDASVSANGIGIVVTTDGDIFIFYSGSYSNMGAKDAVYYVKSTNGGTSFGSAVQFSPALANYYHFRGAVEGLSNVVHAYMWSESLIGTIERHLTSSDALSTVSATQSSVVATLGYYASPPSRTVRSGSTVVGSVISANVSSQWAPRWMEVTSADSTSAPTVTLRTLSATAGDNMGDTKVGGSAGDGVTTHAIWPDSDAVTIRRNADNGAGTFGTAAAWKSSLTSVTKVDLQPITVAGGDVGAFYDNGGAIYFDGYPTLSAGTDKSGSDTQGIDETEAVVSIDKTESKSGSDTQGIDETEALVSLEVSFSKSDTQGIDEAESALLNVTPTGSDTQGLSASETTDLVKTRDVEGSDTQGVDESETGSIAASLTLADTQGIGATESATLAVTVSGADTQGIDEAEARTLDVALTLADTQAIDEAEDGTLAANEFKTGDDSQGIDETETASLTATLTNRDDAAWTPRVYDGVTLIGWLDADQQPVVADDTVLTFGQDASPNANHFESQPINDYAPSNAGPTYQTSELNGGPVYRFGDGDFSWDVYFQHDAVPELNAQPFTIISLVKPYPVGAFFDWEDVWTSIAEGGTDMVALTRNGDGDWEILFSPPTTPVASINLGTNPNSEWQIVSAVIDGADSFGSLDGVVTAGALPSSGATFNGGITIGYDYRFSGNRFDGDMKQVALIKGALSVAEVQKWEGYLADIAGITLPIGHPYRDGPPLNWGIGATEAVSATADIVGADTQSIDDTDTDDLVATEPKSGSDTQGIDGAETGTLAAALAGDDTQAIDEAETGAIAASRTLSDTQAIDDTETQDVAITLAGTDTQAIDETETHTLTVAIAGVDTQGIDEAETGSLATAVPGSDTQGIDDAETGAIAATLSGADTQGIDEAESDEVTENEVPKSGSDTQGISSTETGALSVTASGSDTQGVGTGETGAISASLSGADTQGVDESESGDISLSTLNLSDDDTQVIGTTGNPWTVADASGVANWSRSDEITGLSDNDFVALWPDLSGNNWNWENGGGLFEQPTYQTNELDGKPAIHFDALESEGDQLGIVGLELVQPISVMLVASCSAGGTLITTDSTRLLRVNDMLELVADDVFPMLPLADDDPHVITLILDGSNTIVTLDGTVSSPVAAGSNVGIDWMLGMLDFFDPNTGDYFDVVIAEGAWDEETRQKIEGYGHWYWGLEANLAPGHPYKNDPPTKPAEAVSLVTDTSAADSGVIHSTEARQIAATLTHADNLTIGQAESTDISQPAIGKSGEDSQSVAQSEIDALTAALLRSESQSLAEGESSLLGAAFASQDTQLIEASESAVATQESSFIADDDVQLIVLSEVALTGVNRADAQGFSSLVTTRIVDNLAPSVPNVIGGGGGVTVGIEGGIYNSLAREPGGAMEPITYPPVVAEVTQGGG